MTQTVGRIGAIVGAVVLAQTASMFWDPECGRDAAGPWSIGALAVGVWWPRGSYSSSSMGDRAAWHEP